MHDENDFISSLVQGAIIPCEDLSTQLHELILESCIDPSAKNLKLRKNKTSPDYYLVVLTQDCDLTSSDEKYIECIIAKSSKPNPQLTKGKNPRKLRLPINENLTLELIDTHTCFIPRDKLATYKAAPKISIQEKSKEILIKWRINKYSRSGLPHAFNTLFLNYVWETEGKNDFASYFEGSHKEIIDIYLFITPNVEDANEYWVSFTVLLDPSCPREKSIEIKNNLYQHLQNLSKIQSNIKFVQLEQDVPDRVLNALTNNRLAVYPEGFSFADKLNMHPINLMYLCWPDN